MNTPETKGPATTRSSLPITCAKYEAIPGTKRCRHYHANGACGLPDEFMCVEWLKANGHAPPITPPAKQAARDLFGHPVVDAAPPATPTKPRPLAPMVTREEVPLARTLSEADIASFKALGVEVRLASEDLGDVWLVPAYTGADRQELSVEHAALLATICSALPGAQVTALVRKPKAPVPT
jgi:hypothetical protein